MKIIQKFKRLVFIIVILMSSIHVFGQGPNAPEAASFEPVDAADMINLVTGDVNYVIPLLNVPSPEGGYPLALSYHGGVGYDQEASWLGLGWNINPGTINRSIKGYPDDWKGAKIRDREYFKYTSETIDTAFGWGAWDVSTSFSMDSNNSWSGETSVGFKSKAGVSARIGIGYGNKSKWTASLGLGYKKGNVGIGLQTRSDGATSGGIGVKSGNVNLGVSFASMGSKTGVSASVGIGPGGASITFAEMGNMESFSVGFSGAYMGFTAFLGYQQKQFEVNATSTDYVYGPLYFSEVSQNPIHGEGTKYGGTVAREHNRDFFMDAYSQRLPQQERDFVAFKDVYGKQKNDFTFPAYDNYEVNAQGLSGSIKPRLFENGMIVKEGYDIEYSLQEGGTTNAAYDCYNLPVISSAALGKKIRSDRILVNYHYPNAAHQFKKTFGDENNNAGNINFYFENQFPSTLAVSPQSINSTSGANMPENYLSNSNSAITNRSQSANFVEAFTNKQIEILKTQNNFLEEKNYRRTQDEGYRDHGIGGYRITTADGKTYHYSRPVYHFEEFYRQLAPKNDNDNEVYNEYGGDSFDGIFYNNLNSFYHEKRKEEPFATHWLLTAITGPDYVKNDINKNYPSQGDYGYWVRFDYGKWTDGYVWRNPYDGYIDLTITNTKTSQEYSWGRKQLVYLDKIVTRTHTALFVKSIRKDSRGKNVGGEGNGFPSHEGDHAVSYVAQQPLKLDEIILLKNENYNEISLNESSQHSSIGVEGYHTVDWTSMGDRVYKINQQSEVLDVGDFIINPNTGKYEVYEKADKIIKFGHSYELAQGTLNSTSSGQEGAKGRLTLNEVNTLGRNTYDYMPGYKFDYIGKNINYAQCLKVDGCEKDAWGFYRNNPALWALNQVTVPTGGKLQIEYEKDEYWTEAFSRRYWTKGLTFKVEHYSPSQYKITVKNDPGFVSEEQVDFNDYFELNEKVALDLWMVRRICSTSSAIDDCDRFGTGFNFNPKWISDESLMPKVINVNSNYLQLTVNKNVGYGNLLFKPMSGWKNDDILTGHELWQSDNCPSTWNYDETQTDRGDVPSFLGCSTFGQSNRKNHNMYYGLIANRVPGSGTGGGIRVASISSIDENNNRYKTKYNYNHPTKGRTSGITSYAPIRSEKFVAYQSELPGPRVTYEYVTASDVDINNRVISSRQYRFNVLSPVLDIFNENMEIKNIFKASVINNAGNGAAYLDHVRKTISNEVLLKDNTAIIGSLLESTLLNTESHVIDKQINEYLTFDEVESGNVEMPGVTQESFFNMKSVYNYYVNSVMAETHFPIYNESVECIANEGKTLKKRLINTSSKIIYPVVLKKSTQIQNGTKLTQEYSNIDPKTGSFLTVKSQQADGTYIKIDQVPAYTKYANMGSKVDNIENKHMLTQEAMSVSSWSQYGIYGWKTLDANITTWNDSWLHRDRQGGETTQDGVWRKHKSFVWKDDIVPETGAYVTNVNKANTYFDWGTGAPINEKWKNVSETTRYTHWSSPIESKDINGNYVSSKMAEKETKVIAGGNASYTEMFASGAEYDIGGNWLDQEVAGAQFRDSRTAHTGKYSLKIKSKHKGFNTILKSGEHSTDNYKISVWVNINNPRVLTIMRVNINGVSKPFNGEVVYAGNWAQINHYEFLDNATQNIYITVGSKFQGVIVNIDDFRIHPVYSSINTYVYDSITDELNYILDANNMATKYVYDKAGRLCKLYKEVETELPETNGGFKLINQYKYNYKNGSSNGCNCCDDEQIEDTRNLSKITK